MPGEGLPHHILAIDDSTDVLTLLEDVLTAEGYRVSTTSNPITDVTAVETIRPDLIILDYMLSEDSGWSQLQTIRSSPRIGSIPIIVRTGAVRRMAELRPRLDELEVGVIFKPFDIDELLSLVDHALRSGTVRREIQPPDTGGPGHLDSPAAPY